MQFIFRLSGHGRNLRVQKKHSRGLKLNHVRAARFEKLFPPREEFEMRHIGPRIQDQKEMLKTLGFKVIENLYLINYFFKLEIIIAVKYFK